MPTLSIKVFHDTRRAFITSTWEVRYRVFSNILLQQAAHHLLIDTPLFPSGFLTITPLTPNDLQRRRAVSPLKIKISSKNMRENQQIQQLFIQFINYVW
jgi:hypothetical protein